MPDILTAEALEKVVDTVEGPLVILQSVDLRIAAGERVAIVGASGSGKTTLLGLLAGLDLPSSGRVILDGHELTALDEEERAVVRGASVGFVFQSFQLLDSLTARENVMLPAELRGDTDAGAQADACLAQVGLSARGSHYPRQLSGGEQQRVAIARAFASRPRVLFADEPTGNLDTATGERIKQLLFEMNDQRGTTLVLVTHDVRLAEHCDRSIVLEAGRVVPDQGPAAAARAS